MPIYEYECAKCGHRMEVWQKFSDPPVTTCERCNGRVKKLISQSAFHLKGTGWYVTDYARKSGEGPQKKKETGDKSASTGGSEKKKAKNSGS